MSICSSSSKYLRTKRQYTYTSIYIYIQIHIYIYITLTFNCMLRFYYSTYCIITSANVCKITLSPLYSKRVLYIVLNFIIHLQGQCNTLLPLVWSSCSFLNVHPDCDLLEWVRNIHAVILLSSIVYTKCHPLSHPIQHDTVDGRNPVPVEVGSLSQYLQAFDIPSGAGFLPSTVWFKGQTTHKIQTQDWCQHKIQWYPVGCTFLFGCSSFRKTLGVSNPKESVASQISTLKHGLHLKLSYAEMEGWFIDSCLRFVVSLISKYIRNIHPKEIFLIL